MNSTQSKGIAGISEVAAKVILFTLLIFNAVLFVFFIFCSVVS